MASAPAFVRRVTTRAATLARSALASLARRPLDALTAALAIGFAIATVAWPFSASRYPAMTDLPFHAAETSALRHWFDPSYHFRDQFELQPIAVPYLSSYVLGALLMLVLPAVTAVKVATAIMLLALPAGLAVLSWGMRKSPLLGVAGLPFIWCDLTHWGFVNYVSAFGLFAMAVGLALRAVDRPSWRTSAALGATLVVLFFTHVFRFPFAIAAVVGAGAVAYPATRRWKPLVLPLVPSLALFGAFYLRRPKTMQGTLGPMTIEIARLHEIPTAMVHGFDDPREMASAITFLRVLAVVAVASAALWAVARFAPNRAPEPAPEPDADDGAGRSPPDEAAAVDRDVRALFDRHFTALVTVVPLACAGVFFLMFLTLPMEIGLWWYVYPREITIAAFVALGALPDLPKQKLAKLASVGALGLASLGVTHVVADGYARFGRSTEDFQAIEKLVPRSPKLLYLVFDHSGSNRTQTPYIHLPAWIQAERGGWLSFHFATWGTAPLVYRTDREAVVPPPIPLRWEWTPDRFDLKKQGPFFDWFLVRSEWRPDGLFARDPEIVPVEHRGTWWLYRRDRKKADGAPPLPN